MKRSASSRSADRGGEKNPATSVPKEIAAEQLDELHFAGEDISEYLDWDKATRPERKVQRVNVDFPTELLSALDREAKRIGVSRQAFIKLRIADALKAS